VPRLTGLVAAAHTPFAADGSLDVGPVARQAELFAQSGIAAAFVCGTTGEGASLTAEERRRVAERWTSLGRLPVVVHVGHNCRQEAEALASHAQAAGAAAIAAMAPSFYKPRDVGELLDFLAPVAAAAPRTPFYYYDVPELTGVGLPADRVLSEGARRIPTLAGVKYTNHDLIRLQECLALEGGRFDVLFGYDELLLAALALGARGAVGSTYNYAAPVYRAILAAFERGDAETARRRQRDSVALVRVLQEFGVLRAGKAIMGMIGVEVGPTRAPVRPLEGAERRALAERLRGLDVFSRPLAAS
jgi:N-acetylneuraminate lyase